MNDPDAIWRPGYDGPPPIVEHPADVVAGADPAGEASAEEGMPSTVVRRRPLASRRPVALGVGVVLVLGVVLGVALAVAVVFDPFGDRDGSAPEQAVDRSVFGGSAARLLPASAATLWSVDIEHTGAHWVEVVRRDLVVAAFVEPPASNTARSGASMPTTTVLAFDASTGEERWVREVVGDPLDVAVLGAVDEVLVLEQPDPEQRDPASSDPAADARAPTVVGVDVATGETRWSAEIGGDAAANGGHVGLAGTPFIARLPSPSPSDRFVSLIDARSGDSVGSIVSTPALPGHPAGWSTDGRGTWYVVDEQSVVAYDLRTALGEGLVIGRLDDPSTSYVVVDGRVAAVDEAGTVIVGAVGEQDAVTVPAEVPTQARALTPVSDSTFVVSAPGSISGVGVDDGTAETAWSRRDGVLVEHARTLEGSILQLATRGGAAMQLVDGDTGETIEHLTMVPGVQQALVIAGDGAVVLRTAAIGTKLAGLDLDGSERWSIPGSAPVDIGDRIVVRATSSETIEANAAAAPTQQLDITAFGDPE